MKHRRTNTLDPPSYRQALRELILVAEDLLTVVRNLNHGQVEEEDLRHFAQAIKEAELRADSGDL